MTKSNFILVLIIARQGLEAEAPLLVNLIVNIALQVTDAAVGPLVGGVSAVGTIIVVHVTSAIPSFPIFLMIMFHSKEVPQLVGNGL